MWANVREQVLGSGLRLQRAPEQRETHDNFNFWVDTDHCVRCPESHYADAEQNHCLQKVVTFLFYEDPLGMALTYLALGISALTAGVLGVFVKHHHTPIVKANNQALTYILLITLILFSLSTALHWPPQHSHLYLAAEHICSAVALSTVLAKTLTMALAFKITVPGRLIRWIMITRAPNLIKFLSAPLSNLYSLEFGWSPLLPL